MKNIKDISGKEFLKYNDKINLTYDCFKESSLCVFKNNNSLILNNYLYLYERYEYSNINDIKKHINKIGKEKIKGFYESDITNNIVLVCKILEDYRDYDDIIFKNFFKNRRKEIINNIIK